MFIERCLALVRPGGVVAIVIDDGVLNSPSNTDTREHILRHSDPLAIISLPDTAFMPYATVKSSILLLRKHSGGKQQPLTFFGEAVEVGRKSNGDPLYRVNPVTRKLEPDTDLPTLLSLWNAGQKALQQQSARVRAFWAPIPREDPQFVDAGMRLDLAYHHPARHEAAAALAHARYPLVPLHTLCDVRNEAVVPSQDFQDEEITYIGLANIESHTGEFTPSLVAGASLKSAVKRCLGGDVLFAKMRPELRKVCALPAEHEDAYTSPECLVLVPKISESGQPTVLPELLSHMLRSDLAYGQVVHLVMGIGRPRLNNAAVLNIRLPIPPLDEQQQLLELSKRAEAATAALLAQSERAKEDASELLQRARAELVARLLNQTM